MNLSKNGNNINLYQRNDLMNKIRGKSEYDLNKIINNKQFDGDSMNFLNQNMNMNEIKFVINKR